MTATWAAFQALTPVEIEAPASVYSDVLQTDFGMEDDCAMIARKAILKAKGGTAWINHVKVTLHPDAMLALRTWLRAARYSENSAEAKDRRLARLTVKVALCLAEYGEHPWFNGRALQGQAGTHPPLPAWLDVGVLYPTREIGTVPVILHAMPVKAGSGISVSRFTIEEVEEWQ